MYRFYKSGDHSTSSNQDDEDNETSIQELPRPVLSSFLSSFSYRTTTSFLRGLSNATLSICSSYNSDGNGRDVDVDVIRPRTETSSSDYRWDPNDTFIPPTTVSLHRTTTNACDGVDPPTTTSLNQTPSAYEGIYPDDCRSAPSSEHNIFGSQHDDLSQIVQFESRLNHKRNERASTTSTSHNHHYHHHHPEKIQSMRSDDDGSYRSSTIEGDNSNAIRMVTILPTKIPQSKVPTPYDTTWRVITS
jgi:hypothetical protein